MSDLTGKSIGRYSILSKIGEGGMAVVYLGRDDRLKRDVALKLIRPEMFPQVLIKSLLERFEREAQALARMDHPNIVHIYDFGEYESAPYLVMEYLPGGTLKQYLGKQVTFNRAAAFLSPISRALEYAHAENVIHRDVKPANILFNGRGIPKLGDFGIAKLLGIDEGQTLTGTGMGMGTPAYMAPEQWSGKTSPAVDIYALGVVLFELVSGKPPYQADSPAEIFAQVLMQPVPDIRKHIPDLPEAVNDLLARALAKLPEDRFSDMASMAEALETLARLRDQSAPGQSAVPRDYERTQPMTPPSPPFGQPPPASPPQGILKPVAFTEPESPPQGSRPVSPPAGTDSGGGLAAAGQTLPETPPSPVSPPLGQAPVPPAGDSGSTVMPPISRPPTPGQQSAVTSPAHINAPPPPSAAPAAPRAGIAPAKPVSTARTRPKIPAWVWLVSGVVVVGLIILGILNSGTDPVAVAPTEPAAPTESNQNAGGQPAQPAAPTRAPSEPTQPVEKPAAVEEDPFRSPDPSTLLVALQFAPSSLDPALAYDSSAWEVIQNVYERLITLNHTQPFEFVPQLAEMYDISPDGRTYTFLIREGIRFHNGASLTASDVAYSFQRGLLQGGGSSPQWILSSILLGFNDISLLVDDEWGLYDNRAALQAADSQALRNACARVMEAVTADDAARTVTFHLAWPAAQFQAVLAGPWASIIDRDWAVENGGWDGSCSSWQNYYGTLDGSPFDRQMNGTGPFVFADWPDEETIILARYNEYQREPAWDGAPAGPAALERVIFRFIEDPDAQLAMLESGEADMIKLAQDQSLRADTLAGEICRYDLGRNEFFPCEPVSDGLIRSYIGSPANSRYFAFFNFDIQTSSDEPNPLIGSGKLDGNGIPPDFFSDVHVRRAFNYCFDLQGFIDGSLNGSGIALHGFSWPGTPGFNLEGPRYDFDPERCAQEFQASTWKSPDGRSLWDVGFRVQLVYNQGNDVRFKALQNLAGTINSLNGNFQVEVVGLLWEVYLEKLRSGAVPLFVGGWFWDYYDPHDFAQPIALSYQEYRRLPEELQNRYRELMDAAASQVDPAVRNEIYQELNQIMYEDATWIYLHLDVTHKYEQRWVQGSFMNIGSYGTLYYPIWKK